MIKIKKDGHELIVSKNAYELMYKSLGYKEVNGKEDNAKESIIRKPINDRKEIRGEK